MNKKKNILITGSPGVGKTTLLKKVCLQIDDLHPVGFYTQEIREGGSRVGFEIIGLDGQRGILAHIDRRGPYRVGRYGVDIVGFERYLSTISIEPECNVIIIDEIGKMECYSEIFKTMIVSCLESSTLVLATIALKGDPFIELIKKRSDADLFKISRENREDVLSVIVRQVREQR